MMRASCSKRMNFLLRMNKNKKPKEDLYTLLKECDILIKECHDLIKECRVLIKEYEKNK